ncbi:receptor-like protein 45 [Quercus lobata]|uniref:receptor-like protein 45 n=1 Tax=Quercus lobata TaxID=97700 RepID=UPI001246E542|nr:receptor-like protein 45 [Quercus lobata]
MGKRKVLDKYYSLVFNPEAFEGCFAELTIKTDPQNFNYIVESGATKNFEPAAATITIKEKVGEMEDAMKSLEKKSLGFEKKNGHHYYIGWDEIYEGFSSLSRLKELETLDLGHNDFNRSVMTSLSSLTSLRTLILASNDLMGYFPAEELSTLENLEILDLGSNGLNFSQKMQDYANRRQISKLFKYKNNYGDDDIRSRLVGSCTFT